MKSARSAAAGALTLIVIACGGGDGGSLDDVGQDVFEQIEEASSNTEEPSTATGDVEVGPVTQTADPSTGWFESGGERYEFAAVGSVNYTCEVLEDRITINFQQTTSGSQLTLQASVLDGTWTGNLTFSPGEEEQISYGATIGFDPGTLGLDTDALSYEGSMSRVEDFDVQNAEDVQGTLAVNCSNPGGGTTAEIDGQTFAFPFSGANTLRCSIATNEAEVLIGRSRPEFTQLQIDIRDEGDELFGAASITTDDETYSSFIPPDGAGVTFDGRSLVYEGVFTTTGDQEVEGSIIVNCGS